MSLIPGQTSSRLALFSTVLLGATFCPTLTTIIAGTACLNNLGETYQHLENYQMAIQFYQQALAIKKDLGNR